MNPAEKVLRKIDWKLLRKQKEWLLERNDRSKHERELCNGLIHLLDAIQDCAVDDLGIAERRVFGGAVARHSSATGYVRFTGDALEAKGLDIEADEEVTRRYGERAYGLFDDGVLVGIAFDAGNDNYDVRSLKGAKDGEKRRPR